MKKIISLLMALTMLCGTAALAACSDNGENKKTDDTDETTVSADTEAPEAEPVTLYVSTAGSDENDGSEASPLASPLKALEKAKALSAEAKRSITVIFAEGVYNTEALDFSGFNTDENATLTFKAAENADVEFTNGFYFSRSDFRAVEDEAILARLNADAKDKILVCDLGALGITKEQVGELYSMGVSSTEGYYKETGYNMDLFFGGERMTLAKYPNDVRIAPEEVIDAGTGNDEIAANPDAEVRGGTVRLDGETAERIKSWSGLSEVWTYGCTCYDWADSASPISSFDAETNCLSFAYHPGYPITDGMRIYFYNILEELDTENEYYLDRESLMLYCWFPEDAESDRLMITVSANPIFSGNISCFTMENIDFSGVKGDIGSISGDNITFRGCKFYDAYGNAMVLYGNNNLIYGCEASHLGKGGFTVSGGDRNTLTAGNSAVENCLIHDFGEIYRTYMPAVMLGGCGNKFIHNEIYNCPHEAISFAGSNDLYIAYNYLHDVALEVNDGGALYCGRNWTCYGTVIEYNLFDGIGTPNYYNANAIYLDDQVSGITIRGNIINECAGFGIGIGGGHDVIVEDNIIIIPGGNGIHYDNRGMYNEWQSVAKNEEGSVQNLYDGLNAVPYTSEIWLEKYPVLAQIKFFREECEDQDSFLDADFVGNPSRSIVRHNFCLKAPIFADPEVYDYSIIEDNYEIQAIRSVRNEDKLTISQEYLDANGIEYTNPDLSKIGRYKTEE